MTQSGAQRKWWPAAQRIEAAFLAAVNVLVAAAADSGVKALAAAANTL